MPASAKIKMKVTLLLEATLEELIDEYGLEEIKDKDDQDEIRTAVEDLVRDEGQFEQMCEGLGAEIGGVVIEIQEPAQAADRREGGGLA